MDARTFLHQARLDSQLELSDLASRTALSPAVLRNIDEGCFSELPPGLYARSYVRTFAAEVGLNPALAVQELEHLLPPAPDPFPLLREIAAATTDSWGVPRCAAIATDACILLLINSALVALVAACSGIAAGRMLNEAAPALAAILTVPVVAYFLLFAGVGGRTPGASLWHVPAPPRTRLTLQVILQRALSGGTVPGRPARKLRRFAVN